MSNQDISLVLEKREIIGKGLGKLKAAGKVPGVIHQPGKESIVVAGNSVELNKVFEQAGKHHPVTVTVGPDKLLTIIKDVDFEPTKHKLRHIVFGLIKQNVKVNTEVPVELTGEAPALKQALLVHQHLDVLEISALPKDLPDSIKVPVESLAEIGDKIVVGDIVVPIGVTIDNEPDELVAVVDAPHMQAEEPETSPAEAEAAAVAELTSEPTQEPA